MLPALVLLGALLGTSLIYGPTREFSFFLDDAFDLTRLEAQTAGQVLFQPASDYGYYRPVTFLIFNASYGLTGEHDTSLLRTISLLLHALSAWLLYVFVRRSIRSEWAIAGAALFLLFPFSYQTLNIIGATGHILVTFFVLLSLVLWIEGRYRAVLWLQVAAVVSAILAAWSMEFGVIALPLLLGLELYLRRQLDVPAQGMVRTLSLLGTVAIAVGIYLLIWFGVDRADTASSGIGDVARNGAFWLQAAAYPGTRFLNLLFAGDEPLGYQTVVIVSVLLLAVTLAIHALLGQIRIAMITIGIAGLCFLPAMVMLTHEYVVDSPRLLYVSAPAIAVFWALLGRGVFTNQRLTIAWQGAVCLFVIITLVHSHSFIERRVEMFRISDSVVLAVVGGIRENPDSPVLMMNVPSWFSFHSMTDQEYPLGHLGVQGIPPYVGLDGLYYAATGDTATVESAALAPDVSGWDYAFGPHGPFVDHDHVDERLRSGYRPHIMSLENDGATIHQPGRLMEGSEAGDSYQAVFADRIALTDLDWEVIDSTLEIHTTWYVRESIEGDYQIAIEAFGADGANILEHRDYALDGMSPLRLWRPGDLVRDDARIDTGANQTVDQVFVSLVHTEDETRLEITESIIETRESNRAGY